jgi:hypothetical protein
MLTMMWQFRRGHAPAVFFFALYLFCSRAECGYSLLGAMGARRVIVSGHLALTLAVLAYPPVPSMITCLGQPVLRPENRGLWVLLVRVVRVVRVGHACLCLILNMHALNLLCVLRMKSDKMSKTTLAFANFLVVVINFKCYKRSTSCDA